MLFAFAGSLAAMLLCMYRGLPGEEPQAMHKVVFSATCLFFYLLRRKRAFLASGPDRVGDVPGAVPHDKQDS